MRLRFVVLPRAAEGSADKEGCSVSGGMLEEGETEGEGDSFKGVIDTVGVGGAQWEFAFVSAWEQAVSLKRLVLQSAWQRERPWKSQFEFHQGAEEG